MLIEVLGIVAGVQTLSSGSELSIKSPSVTRSDFLNSKPSDAEERLEGEEAKVDTDGVRRRSRAVVMIIGLERLFLLGGFIPPDCYYLRFSRWIDGVVA